MDVSRVVAVGDVHGAYDALVTTLHNAGIVDDKLAWSGGAAHLVSTGDLLDRGADSRRVMDLLMRLEGEAQRAGGRVHLLLGNHEVMNLIGDLRYVADEEYAAYRDVEDAADRERWYLKFQEARQADSSEAAIRRAFDKRTPPGFFGHRSLLRPDGPYGEWLLSKPFVVVINDTAFVHGGLPPLVAERGLDGINETLKQDLRTFVEATAALQDMDILNPADPFHEYPHILEGLAALGQLTGEALTSGLALVEAGASPLFGPAGPTWYRGTASCSALIEGDALDRALESIGATRVVIGHTTTRTLQVQQRLDGRVVEIDTGMLSDVYKGSGHALVIENGVLSSIAEDGATADNVAAHPLRVGHDALGLNEPELLEILSDGQVSDAGAAGPSWRLVRVGQGGTSVHAVFRALPEQAGFIPELAAYRLDRLLGLGMIPPTVRRALDGQDGTLQFVPGLALSERERVATGRRVDPACGLDKQRAAMIVFDALVANGGRTPSTILFDPDSWQLMLVDHQGAFSPAAELPAYLEGVELQIGREWLDALRALSDEVLLRELADALDERRRLALAQRRDALIALGN